MKKLLALVLSICLLLGIFSFATAESQFKDKMEITLAMWDVEPAFADKANDKLYQIIAEKFNIDIVPVNTTWSDYTEKIQLWAATGALPDIFAVDVIGTSAFRSWTTEGVVRPLLPFDNYPSLKKYFETPDIAAMANAEGKFFAVPRRMFPTTDWSALDRVVSYRWDIAQAAGVTKEPETWDEFKDMLKTIVEKDPLGINTKGLSAAAVKFSPGLFWLYSNPVATSDGSGSDYKWIKEDGKFVPAVFSSKSLASLENARQMYVDGLIDPDIALANVATVYDKFVAGNLAAMVHGGGFINLDGAIYGQRWSKAHPDKSFTECVKQLKPMKNIDDFYAHPIFRTYWSESYVPATVSDEKMERIMALYDFLVSDEGIMLITYGIEGEDYTLEGDKITLLTENLNAKYPTKTILSTLAAYNTYTAYDMENPKIENKDIRQAGVDFINYVIENTKLPEYYPQLTMLSTPSKDNFTVLDHDDMLRIMMGTEPVKDMWEKTLAEYEAKGLSKVIEEVNQAAAEMGLK